MKKMTNNSNTLCTASAGSCVGQPDHTAHEQRLPVWRASFRMALVAAASVVAVGLMATGLTGCADMSGIAPQSSLRDASSLGLNAQGAEATTAQAPVAAEWWRGFGDEQLNTLVAQAGLVALHGNLVGAFGGFLRGALFGLLANNRL